jgi:hypothetical protein
MQADKAIWLQICDDSANKVSVFMQPWWLDIVCSGRENWDVALGKDKHDRPFSAVVWMKSRLKYLVKAGVSPLLTPHCGIWLAPHDLIHEDRIRWHRANGLAAALQKAPRLPWLNIRLGTEPFPWTADMFEDWRMQNSFTYRMDLLQTEAEQWELLDYKVKSKIEKAKTQFKFTKQVDPNAAFALIEAVFDRQKNKLVLSKGMFLALWNAIFEHNVGELFAVNDAEGRLCAFELSVRSGDTRILILSGANEVARNGQASKWLIWEAIAHARASGCTVFDFEGSMMANLAKRNRDYGGKPVPYLFFSRPGNRFWAALMGFLGKL